MEEICPKCHHVMSWGDDTEMQRIRVCIYCKKYAPDAEDRPSPRGFYMDLYAYRNQIAQEMGKESTHD